MTRFALTFAALSLSFAAPVLAQTPPAGAGTHPCMQIEQQCKAAGFVKGQVKEGSGLWVDCIDPIMRGTAQPATAKIKLPAVAPSLVAACKTKNPKFGEGKMK